MKAHEMQNLWVGINRKENFKALICAIDIQEATEIARGYRLDTGMDGEFEIVDFDNQDTKFDCDYVLTNGQ